ncbi:MAG: metal-sulfur cluster assembly factor [Chloroflexi bacterium]|nr:metal-sulfur cluster assembly factor [Chloroflexota bacterium]
MADQPLRLARLLGPEVDAGRLVEELRAVIDPELGVNIVDLGLVYGAEMVDGVAHILMTTTTPACPIGSYLRDEIRWALLRVDRVLDVEVELTHEPPWSPDRMSDAAKAQLGWDR